MRNPERREHQSELGRMGKTGGLGAIAALLTGQGGHATGRAGLRGALRQGVGDALMGQPEEHTFGNEFKTGATGGALVGGLEGLLHAGTHPEGAALAKFIAKNHGGMTPKSAAIAILGAGALSNAAAGALGGGLDSALLNFRREKR